jgi:competence protein ComEC
MGRSSTRNSLLLLTLAFIVGALDATLRLSAISHSPLLGAHTITFVATVKSDPVVGAAKVVGSHLRQGSTTFLATLDEGEIDGKSYSLHLPVRISSTARINFLPGSQIRGTGTIFATSEKRVAALICARRTLYQSKSTDPMNALAGKIRSKFRRAAIDIGGDSAALIPGLVIGDTSLEKPAFVTSMRRAGLTHLTAVSGENFAIIAAFLLWVLQFLIKRLRIRLLITAIILIAFIFLVRPSPSVLRASVMTAVLLIGKARGERGSALPALGFAIALLVLADPFQAIDPGFALSVSATAGILLLGPTLTRYFSRFSRREKLIELLAIPVAATIFCTPLIMAISGQFSLVALPANFLVAEVVGPVTVIGFIAALISPLSLGIAHLIMMVCKPFAAWVVLVALYMGSIPVLIVPKSYFGAVIALVVITLIVKKMWRTIACAALVIVATHFLLSSGWPGNWAIVNCDVGQGDGSVINLGHHSGIVIDVGPDPNAMNNCLKSLQIDEIPLLVLTHYHADHVNGLAGAMAGRHIGAVWVTNNPAPAFEYQQTLSLLGNIPRTIVHQGQSLTFASTRGQVKIVVLWPQAEIAKLPSLPGDGSGINNSSIALLISIGKLTFYTSGDTEPPAQEEIARSGLLHQVDVVKVSHHGSAYQYSPLIDLLHPRIALISVGVGNSYGHPAPSTIADLENRGIKVLRTDLDGAIVIGEDLKIRTQKRKWWDISWG